MTFKIPLSQIKSADEFAADVAAYIKAKKDHQKTTGEPAPTAAPMVEAAVRVVPGSIEEQRADDYVADYSVEDDTPPPPSFEDRKAALVLSIRDEGEARIAKFFPPLKRNHMHMLVSRASRVEEDKRTNEQKAVLAHMQDIAERADAIQFHVAEQQAAVHDLTAETIDDWAPEPFPS
jgi:hypothetical protein